MYNNKKVIVVIPAAGSGNRMDTDLNKLLLTIKKDTIIEITVKAFQEHNLIDSIIVITNNQKIINILNGYSKIKAFVNGGKSRQESIKNGLDSIDEKNSIIVIHDAARPFIKKETITEAIKAANQYGAAIVAVKTIDTIKKSIDKEVIETLVRDNLINVQTPQVFKYEIIKEAYNQKIIDATDDSSLIEQLGYVVHVIEGSYDNIKITTKSDLDYANFIRGENKMDMRIGIGFDVHRFIEGRPLVLGGVNIPFKLGLDGHSDADVLLHAIMDAILGSVGKGDIGRWFPDSDKKYIGISSLKLLEEVYKILESEGYKINNIDTVVVAQEPKIFPYIERMVENISSTLRIESARVNIKGTTTENLGFEGRGEGISAQAIVTVDKI